MSDTEMGSPCQSERSRPKCMDAGGETGQSHQAELDSKRPAGGAVEQLRPLQTSNADVDDARDQEDAECWPRDRLVSVTGQARELALAPENRIRIATATCPPIQTQAARTCNQRTRSAPEMLSTGSAYVAR